MDEALQLAKDAIELAEEAIPYAGDWFDQKWQLSERLEQLKVRRDTEIMRAALRKGGPGV